MLVVSIITSVCYLWTVCCCRCDRRLCSCCCFIFDYGISCDWKIKISLTLNRHPDESRETYIHSLKITCVLINPKNVWCTKFLAHDIHIHWNKHTFTHTHTHKQHPHVYTYSNVFGQSVGRSAGRRVSRPLACSIHIHLYH